MLVSASMLRRVIGSCTVFSLVACPAREPATGATDVPATTVTAASGEPGTGLEATRTEDIVDTMFGRKVADPYRWLENVQDPEVRGWMRKQDDHARGVLASLPGREAMAKRLAELSYIDSISAPYRRGERFFYSRSHRDKEKGVYYVRKGEKGAEEVLIDPNTLSDDGSISLHGIMPSKSGRYLAYKLSRNNADASTMYVRDLDTGRELEIDTIEGARYAYAAWTPDDRGFYYVWLPTDPAIPAPALPGHAEVRFHELGTDPKTDAIISPATGDPTRFVNVGLSRDGRWLMVGQQRGWTASDTWFADLGKTRAAQTRAANEAKKGHAPKLAPLVVGRNAVFEVQAWRGKFYIHTNDGAPRYHVYVVDPANVAFEKWKEIVPETDAVLEGAGVVGDHLVLSYLRDAHSEIEVRTLAGKPVRKVELPGIGSSSGLFGEPDEDEAYYYFSSYTDTTSIFKTSISTGTTALWERPKVPVDTTKFVTEQVWYPSKDGTNISMFVIRRKDIALDGSAPTMLTGYGGFNVSLTPGFSSRVAVWVEQGGVWAVPNLRGGGEYGEAWHQAGMRANKQNVFDDFAAAAEYLIAKKYTRADKLAIYGGSNGGLLVGAAMTQRPELFGAVICAVPLLDMVRYHLYGTGTTWIDEYGTPEDSTQFETLIGYSPYHRIKAGTEYPAMLMLSADSDDRVDPMHARKFTAAIQAASTSKRPALLRIETNAGHGGADLIKQQIEQTVDMFAFARAELHAD